MKSDPLSAQEERMKAKYGDGKYSQAHPLK